MIWRRGAMGERQQHLRKTETDGRLFWMASTVLRGTKPVSKYHSIQDNSSLRLDFETESNFRAKIQFDRLSSSYISAIYWSSEEFSSLTRSRIICTQNFRQISNFLRPNYKIPVTMVFCNNHWNQNFAEKYCYSKESRIFLREVNLILIYCSEHQDIPIFAESKFTLWLWEPERTCLCWRVIPYWSRLLFVRLVPLAVTLAHRVTLALW